MNLFQKIFSNISQQKNHGYKMKLITEIGNGFYSWNGKLYKSDIIRSCIRPKVRAMGKLTAMHIREAGEKLQINPEPYMRFLLEDPNPYMTGQMLQEKMTAQLMLNHNAFALIVRDDNGYPVQIYPIQCTSAETIYDSQGEIWIKFWFENGTFSTFNYTNIIHLRRDFNGNDMYGESPADVLMPLMEIVTTTDQGVVKAIKNSNIIRWLLKFKTTLRGEDIDDAVEKFTKSYLSISTSSGGAAGVDAKYDLEQVKPESYVPNAPQMDRTKSRIQDFFNTNEKIVQSKWSEDDWNAYYEAEIEPDAMQLANEYTRKLFTRKERGFGNKIIFEASNLQYASMNTKLNLFQMVDRGAMTPNQWRKVLNMGPIEGGEKPIRRKDTGLVQGGEE